MEITRLPLNIDQIDTLIYDDTHGIVEYSFSKDNAEEVGVLLLVDKSEWSHCVGGTHQG